MKLVSGGAQLECSYGSAKSDLTVLPTHRTAAGQGAVATVMDCVPSVNIIPFGMCSSLANPSVVAATAANFGKLTPQPCVPDIQTIWGPPDPRFSVNGLPMLTDACSCMCKWAGQVKVSEPGQSFASISAGTAEAVAALGAALAGVGGTSSQPRVEAPASLERPEGKHVLHQFICEMTGKPLAGVRWFVRTRRGKTIAEGVTGDDGFVVAEVPAAGGYLLEYDEATPLTASAPHDDWEEQHG